ncbi:MAG TPA: hypothetical protein VLG44_04780, partial [Chlamydiales bacterium]|nr:hypothetical protein [Chlamydiales bacterium]
ANTLVAMSFQFALSMWIVFVFSRIYPQGGIKNGLVFGLFFGVFAGMLTASWYLWLKVPAKLGISWLVNGIVEGVGGGFVLGCLSRQKIQKTIE